MRTRAARASRSGHVTKRSRWRCSTAARPAHGACHGPETGAVGLMAAMKATTCGSTFANAHRDSGIRCSSSQKSAGPAGRQLLREARAAPGRAPAVLLGSLRASNCASFVTRLHCSHEPHCTSFWSLACPMGRSGVCGAPPSRALRDRIGWRARRAFAI